MPAAVVGGAIAAAGAVGGAAISASSSKKAANKAAQAQTDATTANNALQQQIYQQNAQTLSPYVQSGYGATSAINALLGLGGGQANTQSPPNQPMGTPIYGQTNGYTPGTSFVPYNAMKTPDYGASTILGAPVNYGPTASGMGYGYQNPQTTQAAPQPNQQQNYQNAFDNYRNSTGYQFRVGEGQRALDNSYASRGVGQSGAAAKAALNYGQNIASGEFNNYLNSLFNVSNLGLSAAGAQAGVSTNYANTVGANNNAAASALGNAALLRGQANAGLYSTIGNSLGQLGGNIFASSFGGGGTNAYGINAGNIY